MLPVSISMVSLTNQKLAQNSLKTCEDYYGEMRNAHRLLFELHAIFYFKIIKLKVYSRLKSPPQRLQTDTQNVGSAKIKCFSESLDKLKTAFLMRHFMLPVPGGTSVISLCHEKVPYYVFGRRN